MINIINKKKLGKKLTKEEIQYFISQYAKDLIPDYQTSALLMAIRLKGMDKEEISHMTLAMRDSGEIADLTAIKGIKVDKHSTGGVADTTTLITLPLAAACGVKIAKMSGAGLGHTGGTSDKLSSIPGYQTKLSPTQFFSIINQCGVSLIGQNGSFAPADKKLYALRDATGTVDSLPLIASSIMSKKLAAGSDALVLDVKTGSGALLQTIDEAKELATLMSETGNACGLKTVAIISDMNQPLGQAIGNSLEVIEACEILKTGKMSRLTRVALILAAQMILLGGKAATYDDAMLAATQALHNGEGLKKLKEMVALQGGDPLALENHLLLPTAKEHKIIHSPKTGYIAKIQTDLLGQSAMLLGAGRRSKEDHIDLSAGIWIDFELDQFIKAGDPLATLYASNIKLFQQSEELFLSAIEFSNEKPQETRKLIYAMVN